MKNIRQFFTGFIIGVCIVGIIILLLVGCSTHKVVTEYRQSPSYLLVDSVAHAENWDIPSYKEWIPSIYMAVADGDTTIIKVYSLWKKKNKLMYIFSVTEENDSIIQVNFRKE